MSDVRRLAKLLRVGASIASDLRTEHARRIAQLVHLADAEHDGEEWRTRADVEEWLSLAAQDEKAVAAEAQAAARSSIFEPDSSDEEDEPPSRLALARGKVPLRIGQSSKLRDGHLVSTLRHFAIQGDARSAYDLLVSVHPDACEMRSDGSSAGTPLMEACICGHLEFVEVMLKHGAMVDYQEIGSTGKPRSGTPLHYAAVHGHPAIVSCLLLHGASADVTDHEGRTALEWATRSHGQVWSGVDKSRRDGVRRLLTVRRTCGDLAARNVCHSFWNGRVTRQRSHLCTRREPAPLPITGWFERLGRDLLEQLVGLLAPEDANELARTSMHLYAAVHAVEQSMRREHARIVGALCRRGAPGGEADLERHVLALRAAMRVPLFRRVFTTSTVKWPLCEPREECTRPLPMVVRHLCGLLGRGFEQNLALPSPPPEWPHRGVVLATLAEAIDNADDSEEVMVCLAEDPLETNDESIRWLAAAVDSAPLMADACMLLERLCCLSRDPHCLLPCVYGGTARINGAAACVEAVCRALMRPEARGAAAYALAALQASDCEHPNSGQLMSGVPADTRSAVVARLLGLAVDADPAVASAGAFALRIVMISVAWAETAWAETAAPVVPAMVGILGASPIREVRAYMAGAIYLIALANGEEQVAAKMLEAGAGPMLQALLAESPAGSTAAQDAEDCHSVVLGTATLGREF